MGLPADPISRPRLEIKTNTILLHTFRRHGRTAHSRRGGESSSEYTDTKTTERQRQRRRTTNKTRTVDAKELGPLQQDGQDGQEGNQQGAAIRLRSLALYERVVGQVVGDNEDLMNDGVRFCRASLQKWRPTAAICQAASEPRGPSRTTRSIPCNRLAARTRLQALHQQS